MGPSFASTCDSSKESLGMHRLPSIHSLSLELPTMAPLPPLGHNGYSRPIYATPFATSSVAYNSHMPIAGIQVPASFSAPSAYLTSQKPPSTTTLLRPETFNSHRSVGAYVSPISSPNSRDSASYSHNIPSFDPNIDYVNRNRSQSDPARSAVPLKPNARNESSQETVVSSSDEITEENLPFETTQVSESVSTYNIEFEQDKKPKWKPRKKRKCPDCDLYFSNLATHKSTHLNPTSRPHICKYCNRGFARPNDLFRHTKSHWKEIGSDKGQFKCPFKKNSSEDYCCHETGIFSRCDTFKNHLKAIHFQYPRGTKKDQRSKVSGSCRMCSQKFKNVDDWLINHIERNSCSYGNELKKE